MNYLGHAFLSFGNAEVLVGNMIGDHVKGRLALDKYPRGIKNGILLHRAIDEMADRHPAVIRAKLLFRADYGLYSGAIIDTLFDHFLANDPKYFQDENALASFTKAVYSSIDDHSEHLPEVFAGYFPHMKEHNWLYNYRNLKGMERSLAGLARRAKYIPPVDKAYATFVAGYYQLNQCYFDFVGDMVEFSKREIERMY
ncbi:MAG: DUF479 domain-containing protein [Flavipsychrobacter sp.]|nr:DUF479 domain-containing protein [Flavipsychrobacter sp.]